MRERELEWRRRKIASMLAEWRHDEGAQAEFAEWRHTFDGHRPAVEAALVRLEETSDLVAFGREVYGRGGIPSWMRQGSHRTFLAGIAQRTSDPVESARVVAHAYRLPDSEEAAAERITLLFEHAQTIPNLYPGPGMAPVAASHVWALQDFWSWPSFAGEGSFHVLGWLTPESDPGRRYLDFRALLLSIHDDPFETLGVQDWLRHYRTTTIDGSLYERCDEAAELILRWYKHQGYQGDEEATAKADAEAIKGELELVGRSLEGLVSNVSGRRLAFNKIVAKTGWSGPVPYRADGYATWQLGGMTDPSIRLWASRSGLAIGLYGGSRNQEWYKRLGDLVEGRLPDGIQFFNIRSHRTGDRLEPVAADYQGGEFLVGRWYPGGLEGDVSAEIESTVAALQPVLDEIIRESGIASPTTEPSDDWLAPLVDEFLQSTGYPTETDRGQIAEREVMSEIISSEGLRGFDLAAFRRIFNSSRYGGTGPQSVLNASLRPMGPDELEAFADSIEFLLRGDAPIEARIRRLLDPVDLGVRGLGESVITKLLSIAEPERFIPVFVYTGPKGKGVMLTRLDLDTEETDDLPRAERAVRSNDVLRERLEPYFPGDPYGMKEFLYWLLDQPEEETPPETDDIGNLAEELLIDQSFLEDLVKLLEDKGQIILYGPPGTGKTYVARELAKVLAPDPRRHMIVQFHPSTSYEDFFEGYRPETDVSGQLSYHLTKGPLAILADQAEASPRLRHVMVIDEINRANLPKVMGELLFLLEYRTESVRTLYRPDDAFELPRNLWLIGTMNTADRSIALVDAAMRRRFHFVPFFPQEWPIRDLLRRWLAEHGPDEQLWVADLLDMVNSELYDRLGGPHLQIGPSHFMRDDLSEQHVRRIWTYNLYPYIEEQLFGDLAAIRQFEFDNVIRRFRRLTGEDTGTEGGSAGVEPEEDAAS
jgi:5-methylcytosine-specific restriction protein B